MNARRNSRNGLALWAMAVLTSVALTAAGPFTFEAGSLGMALPQPKLAMAAPAVTAEPLDIEQENFGERFACEAWSDRMHQEIAVACATTSDTVSVKVKTADVRTAATADVTFSAENHEQGTTVAMSTSPDEITARADVEQEITMDDLRMN